MPDRGVLWREGVGRVTYIPSFFVTRFCVCLKVMSFSEHFMLLCGRYLTRERQEQELYRLLAFAMLSIYSLTSASVSSSSPPARLCPALRPTLPRLPLAPATAADLRSTNHNPSVGNDGFHRVT